MLSKHSNCSLTSLGFNVMQMQGVSEACSLDDDMMDGDLGDGMGVRNAPSSTRKKNQSLRSSSEPLLPGAGEATLTPGLKITEEQRAHWKVLCCGKIV